MRKEGLKIITKTLLTIGGLALAAVLFLPIWRIELDAPQYPEGLALTIHANGLKGNVDIINGLNHYIGMKTLHNEDFIEFTVLPYIIAFFVAAFMVTAMLNKKRWLYTLFILFVLFGVLAMVDFWRWEYNYGHDLNPDAAIVVPGMAYQPPLIGFKQLLNFGAFSIPDTGGWIFIGAGLILVICLWLERKTKKTPVTNVLLLPLLFISLNSCNVSPEPIKIGTDNCYFCKMTITDPKFGGEVITKKGKVFKFDDVHCLLSYLKTDPSTMQDAGTILLVNYDDKHDLITAEKSFLLQSETLHSPMNGNIAAFSKEEGIVTAMKQYEGKRTSWGEIIK